MKIVFYLAIVEGVEEGVGDIDSVTSVTMLSYKGVSGNLKSRYIYLKSRYVEGNILKAYYTFKASVSAWLHAKLSKIIKATNLV